MSKIIEKFVAIMKRASLVGSEAHTVLAPKISGNVFRRMIPTDDAKKSATLIPIFEKEGELFVLLTLRSMKLKSHSGQISFPGGRIEKGETALNAALRETEEEIGIKSNSIEVIRALSPLYVEPSNSLIFPFIGIIDYPQDFIISENEVSRILLCPLEFVKNKNNIKEDEWNIKGIKATVPYWNIGAETPLWGATAMILSELLTMMDKNV
jgi:8-oxo-dGTP pyrophosphatase MutT (NUDIX family)